MTIKEKLMEDMKDAMRNGDVLRRDTIRLVRTAIKNAEMARSSSILDMIAANDPKAKGGIYDEIKKHRKLADEYTASEQLELAQKESDQIGAILASHIELDDAAVQDVIRKEIKQRREAADIYEKAKRVEMMEKEQAEAAVLEGYLPKQMGAEEIEAEVREVIAGVGSREMSKIMPAVMQRLKGRAEGRAINQVVTKVLGEA